MWQEVFYLPSIIVFWCCEELTEPPVQTLIQVDPSIVEEYLNVVFSKRNQVTLYQLLVSYTLVKKLSTHQQSSLDFYI